MSNRRGGDVSLSEFIAHNTEQLLVEWEARAHRAGGGSRKLTKDELRNRGTRILNAVAENLTTTTTADEIRHRPEGDPPPPAKTLAGSAQRHAVARWREGFDIDELIAEIRALRATVVRRWAAEAGPFEREKLDELVRFDETVDELLTESIKAYSARLDRARELFTSILGHDLRSPLSAAYSAAEYLLTTEQTLDAEQVRAVARIRNSVGRIRGMVDDLQDFSRSRLGGELPLSLEHVDLVELVIDVVDEFRAHHPGRDFRLKLSRPVVGRWDRKRIQEVLSNLISNALSYGRDGAPVTASSHADGDEAVISVHNDGDPIPRELQPVIFDPLVRSDVHDRRRGKGDGLGLGLHIAKQIVDAHGGRFELSSEADAGTTFTVRLPRQTRPPAP